MRKTGKIIFIILGLLAIMPIRADENFRRHRYDALTTLPPAPKGSIIFLGNSITHMMEWQELFGNRQDIFNRGVSGAHTYEVAEHLEKLLGDSPSKVFLMIGTNDLGDSGEENMPPVVAERIISIIEKIKELHPVTKIFYQSILPTGKRWRTREKTELTNAIVKNWIDNQKNNDIVYVDLYPAFVSEEGEIRNTDIDGNDSCLSLDGLHLTFKGYEIWADLIKEYVGTEPEIKKESINLFGDLSGSPGMRVSYFGSLPGTESDVLLFGDEMIHSGEWNELTGNGNFKDRGIGWGYPGPRIKKLTGTFLPTLKGNSENNVLKKTPAGVIFYAGISDVIITKDITETIRDYKIAVDSLRTLLPETPIFLLTLAPFQKFDIEKNENLSKLNDSIRKFSQQPGFHLIDIENILTIENENQFGEFKEKGYLGINEKGRNETYFMDSESLYLNGEGFKVIAEKLKEEVESVIEFH